MSNFDAGNIESIYFHKGANAAEDALRDDYLHADSPEKQQKLAAEMTKLKQDEGNTHLLAHVSLEFVKPMTEDDKITKARLSDIQNYMGNSPEDKFKKDMVEIAKSQYGDLTSFTSIRHDAHLLNPLNWTGRGVMDTDIARVEQGYEQNRQKTQAVIEANEMFAKDDGALFKRIAGDRGTIDRETLSKALDADKTEDPSHRRFNDQERQAVQTMVDNWDDPAVNQLKNGQFSASDIAKVSASFIPGVGTVPGAYHGWKSGYEWGGWLGGVGGAIGGTLAGLTGIGSGAIEYEARKHAAGELTLDKIQGAAKDSSVSSQVMAYDSRNQTDAARGGTQVADQNQRDSSLDKVTVQAPKPIGQSSTDQAQTAAAGDQTATKPGGNGDAQTAAANGGKPGGDKDKQNADGGETQAAQKSVEVQPGEGYWDVAARMLGYTDLDDGKTLQQRRHDLNAGTTPEEKAEIFQLMTQLMNQAIDGSKKLQPGQVVNAPPDADANVPPNVDNAIPPPASSDDVQQPRKPLPGQILI